MKPSSGIKIWQACIYLYRSKSNSVTSSRLSFGTFILAKVRINNCREMKRIKQKKYSDAFRIFIHQDDDEFAQARDNMRYLNSSWRGATLVSLLGIDALNTGAALVLILVTRSSTKPVDFRNIGYGCNLPVSRRRLQRDFNRTALETKIGFYRRVTNVMVTANVLSTQDIRYCWAEGVLDIESWSISPSLRIYQAFGRVEINQFDKDISKFGQNAARAVLTQIARYLPKPNPSTELSNEGFILPFSSREVNLWVI